MDVTTEIPFDQLTINATPAPSLLCRLPTELILLILSHLPGHSLAAISATCQLFYSTSSTPRLWHHLLGPALSHLTSPAPYASFKFLFGATHYHLWLCGRLWHSDRIFTGTCAVSFYCPASGAIKLCRLLATDKRRNNTRVWTRDGTTAVPLFVPLVYRWTDDNLMMLSATDRPDDTGEITYEALSHGITPVFTSLLRARAVRDMVSGMSVWPPLTVPADDRARNTSRNGFRGTGHKPQDLREASSTVMRLRKWMRFKSAGVGASLQDNVETYSALKPALWKRDVARPWQGVWIGDYNQHGAEFVLLNHKGKGLDAIKLTGDLNVPRGEYTWRVDDLCQVVRVTPAEELEWPNAVVVEGRGQIAGREFANAAWLPVEIILASPERVVAVWDFAELRGGLHVSVYRRVDVDVFLKGREILNVGKGDEW